MPLPVVVIVGRTNVGKSVLFNRLARERVAVVEDTPGITRDRIYKELELDGRRVMLVDTGGLVGAESDELITQVKEQAAMALSEADLLLMVVDGQEGLTSLDYNVADVVRRSGKPYILIANKMESKNADSSPFADLRMGLPIDISALHGQNIYGLIDEILERLPEAVEELEPRREGETAIAVIGRPNVGKSALINALLGEPRVIVSEEPGTTRDAIDIELEVDGEPYRLVDTAGLRRRGRRAAQGTEYYSSLRALKALQRADLALVVIDAAEGVTSQDAHIAGEADLAGRGLAIVANKWDKVLALAFGDEEEVSAESKAEIEKLLRSDFERMARHQMAFAGYASVLYTSAITGQGVAQLLPEARRIAQSYRMRISTGQLNRAIQRAVADHQPPSRGRRQLRIYYASQVRTGPPTFVVFVNDPKLMHFSYERYLINKLREAFGFEGTPIKLFVRKREGGKGR